MADRLIVEYQLSSTILRLYDHYYNYLIVCSVSLYDTGRFLDSIRSAYVLSVQYYTEIRCNSYYSYVYTITSSHSTYS